MNRRSFSKFSACMAGSIFVPQFAKAQNTLPSVVTIVVPFSPGGSNDVFARALAQQLSEELKTNFIVENRPGAGGTIGGTNVARSSPDGSRLLLTSNTIVTNYVVQAKPPFDPVNSFAHVAILNKGPSLLIIKKDSQYNDLPSFFEAVKKGDVKTFGSAGIGSSAHLAGEMLNDGLGASLLHVPYKGMSNVASDIIGDNVDMVITTAASVSGQMQGGFLKAIGVTSPQASPFFAGLPPISEQIPQYDVEAWWGIFAPLETPAWITETLNEKINEISQKKVMAELYKTEATTPVNFGLEEITKFLTDEQTKWSFVAKSRNIQPV